MTRKLIGALGTLVFVLVFNFFLFRVVESDPVATLFRGTRLTEDQRARLYDEFGVNDPLPEQFAKYVRETSQLNFGYSYEGHRPVRSEIGDALWPTVWLVGLSTLLSTAIGLALGVFSGWRRGTRGDYASTGFSMFTYSMPDFWLGLLLLGFLGSQLGWFPTGGISDPGVAGGFSKLADQARHLVLPCLTLTVAYLGEYAIVMRSSLLDTLGEDYLLLARAKGPARCAGSQETRGSERAPPRGHARRDQLRLRALRGDRGRVDLLLARPRARDVPGNTRARPTDAPGALPPVQRGGDRREPGRRPPVLVPGPAGEDLVTATQTPAMGRRHAARAYGAAARSRAHGRCIAPTGREWSASWFSPRSSRSHSPLP